MASIWGITPRQSVEAECRRTDLDQVVDKCLAILRQRQVDDGFLFVIGGPGARNVLDGREGGIDGYWPRVWALRALMYAWTGRGAAVVIRATGDDSWRVREMAAKVIARHQLDEGLAAVLELGSDEVARVRSAAERAKQRLTSAV